MAIKPNTKTPELDVDTVGGGRFRLSGAQTTAFDDSGILSRGPLPDLQGLLRDLDQKVDEFAGRGVDGIAISADSKERATKSKTD